VESLNGCELEGHSAFTDQLTIQIHVSSLQDDASSVGALTQTESNNFDMTLRTVNIPKGKDGLGLSIKVYDVDN